MLAGQTKTLGVLTILTGLALLNSSPANAHAGHSRGHHHQRYLRLASGEAHVIQCVAFAKQNAGIDISGNARDWWANAAGIYERGSVPESGSVLSFRANGRMPLGHVAVVAGIHDSRTITIDQSHWNSRGISRDIEVEDVSDNNDWSAVRVQLGHGGGFGSIYATHGFIYARPDQGTFQVVSGRAQATRSRSGLTTLATARGQARFPVPLELAELPGRTALAEPTLNGVVFDAPNRGLR